MWLDLGVPRSCLQTSRAGTLAGLAGPSLLDSPDFIPACPCSGAFPGEFWPVTGSAPGHCAPQVPDPESGLPGFLPLPFGIDALTPGGVQAYPGSHSPPWQAMPISLPAGLPTLFPGFQPGPFELDMQLPAYSGVQPPACASPLASPGRQSHCLPSQRSPLASSRLPQSHLLDPQGTILPTLPPAPFSHSSGLSQGLVLIRLLDPSM